MSQPVVIKIFKNGQIEGVKQFTQDQIVIGANTDGVHLQLVGATVSPIHAVIEKRDSGYYISDLGSEVGTYIDDKKIFDETIESGERIAIADYILEFYVGVPKPKAPPTPPPIEPPKKEDVPALQEEILVEKAKDEDTSNVVSIAPESSSAPSQEETVSSPNSIEEKVEVKEAPAPSLSKEEAVEEKEPVVEPTVSVAPVKSKKKSTFAPPSQIKNLNDHIRPGSGPVLEILVAWGDRIIDSQHFPESQNIYVGSGEGNDILVPVVGTAFSKHKLVQFKNGRAVIILTPEMQVELTKGTGVSDLVTLKKNGRIASVSKNIGLQLEQDELVHIILPEGGVSFYVRYTHEAPKPILAPMLDFTASEVTGVVMSIVLGVIFGLYMMVYSPSPLEDEKKLEEPVKRMAKVIFKPPRPKVQLNEKKVAPVKKQKKIVKITEKKKNTTTRKSPGKAAGLKKMPKKAKRPTSVIKKGGAKKISKNAGSNMKAPPKKKASESGLLGVFGSRGNQKKLAKTFDGAGGLIGAANTKTGYAGQNSNRAGDALGGRLKSTGAGGKGSSIVGVGSVGTKGRGTGGFGNGTGGIGQRGRVDINIGGADAEIEGFIDKEAIRRVIKKNKRSIKICYEQQLNRQADLHGKVVLEWYIEEEGRVYRAKAVSNTLPGKGGKAVERCIVRKLKTWTFPEPPPDQIGEVRYPFVFSSQ